jgi:hypothetical protein
MPETQCSVFLNIIDSQKCYLTTVNNMQVKLILLRAFADRSADQLLHTRVRTPLLGSV